MGFFSKLKRALGFGGDSADEEDDALLCDTETDCAMNGNTAVMASDEAGVLTDATGDRGFSDDMRSRIFDHVVEVFNGAMPEFIRNSVDKNAQSEYIYKTLDDSIKAYFDNFESALRLRLEKEHQERDRELAAEIARLKSESKKIEDDRSAIKERQLSADRQKRALGDRVHELEQQVAALDSEREQLQLENKSMLNKLKVAQLQGSDETIASRNMELEALIEKVNARNNELSQENEKLHEAMTKQSDMHDISEAMMGDLRQSAAKAREELNQYRTALESANKELETTRKRLAEAEAIVAEAKTINDELGVLMTELDKREARIAKLKKEKSELRRKLDAMQQLVADDSETAAYGNDLSAPEAALEIELSAPVPPETDEPEQKLPKPGPRRPRITDEALDDIDQQFDNETWTDDSHESAKPTIEKETARQNRKKHTPADDVQLSLF